MRTPKQAAKDLALYFAVSVAVIAPPIVAAFYDWHPHNVVDGVFACLYTGLIFGPFLRKASPHWRETRFWYGTAALFVMHCGVLFYLAKQQHTTVWLLVPIAVIEGGTLTLWASNLANKKQRNTVPE